MAQQEGIQVVITPAGQTVHGDTVLVIALRDYPDRVEVQTHVMGREALTPALRRAVKRTAKELKRHEAQRTARTALQRLLDPSAGSIPPEQLN